jgi:hypothetical protein
MEFLVLDWVESEPQTRVSPGEFSVVQKWPGHYKAFGPAQAMRSLSALGFSRHEVLFLQLFTTAGDAPARYLCHREDAQGVT